jgi:hypothetical protein
MSDKNESAVKANFEQAGDQFARAATPFICGMNEWIEWRVARIQDMRQEIVEKTRLTRKGDPAIKARAAGGS